MAFIAEREIVSFVTEIGRVDVHAFPSLYAKAQFICSVEFCSLCCLIPLNVIFPGKTSDSVRLIADLVRCLRIVLLAHPLPSGRFIRPAVENKDGGGLTKKGLCNRHQIIEQRWRIRELVLGFGEGSHSWARSKFRPLLFKVRELMTHKIDQENRGPWEVCKNLIVRSHADKITTAPDQKSTLKICSV